MNGHVPVLRRREVAELLKLSVNTVSRLVERGELEAFTVGGRLRISAKSVEEFMGFSLDSRPSALSNPS